MSRVVLFPGATEIHRGRLRPSTPAKDTAFIRKMRELEVMSPSHARVLMDLACSILDEQRPGKKGGA